MIPFSPPRIDKKIIDEVSAAMQSGWITTGPRTKKFEKEITAFCGHPATLCVSSATAGMELMLKWFGIKPGDEVIIPAYTYCATANVVVHCGAKPVMIDVGTDFNINERLIKQAITSRTKAIMPVDLGGWPCNYPAIMDIAKSDEAKALFNAETKEQADLGRILVLSDAAHSFGASVNGIATGKLADITVFSFHAVKNLTTAEGGAICLNLPAPFDNDAIYKYLCVKSLHGQTKDALAKTKTGGWRYDVVEPGYKCNMTDIQAAMGLVEIERYRDDMLKRRKEIFDAYSNAFSLCDWAEIPPYINDEKSSSFHVFLLRVKNITEGIRDKIIDEITSNQVGVNVHFIPLPLLSYYKNNEYRIEDYPVAYDNFSREITLPVYYDLSDDNVRIVIETVKKSVLKFI
ncbi:MAG: DegT/DnrJ/EryC1/StrS family aminotransferase [Bacteroidales bacterium]|nr:DegT/DnrJ/EryC1/StrS family aminotransferase [Bacteroidales bacterium]